MDAIEFTAHYGDETKQVELSYLTGGYYHIYIDRYYLGQIHKVQGKWTVLLQNPEEMTMDDRDVLIEMIEQHQRDSKQL